MTIIKKNTYPLIGLDFDGVLFDSAYEAYWVAESTALRFENFKSFDFKSFMMFRTRINQCRDFVRFYSLDKKNLSDDFLEKYEKNFQAIRATYMNKMGENYIKKFFPALDFFKRISHFLTSKPDQFCIISTRDESSIRQTLKLNNINLKGNIIGRETFIKYNSKSKSLRHLFGNDFKLKLYVDDIYEHCTDMKEVSEQVIQADWGYGELSSSAASYSRVSNLIKEICN